MGELPLVSVMVPTYRQESLVANAVGSVLVQTYPNIEVVVGDDDPGSNAAARLVRFAGDPRFRYAKAETNRGRVGNYRWLLHSLARGQYTLNLDGDDLLADRGYISRAVSVLQGDPSVALVFARRLSFSGAPPLLSPLPEPRVAIIDGTKLFLDYWKRGTQLNHLTAVYRRADAIALDFYRRDIVSSDVESLLRLIPGRKIAFVDTVAGLWRSHGGNASVSVSVPVALENLSMADSICSDLSARGVLPERQLRWWRRWFVRSRIYGQFCTQFWDKGRYREGSRFLIGAARAYPLPAWSLVADVRLVARLVLPRAGRIATRLKSVIARRAG